MWSYDFAFDPCANGRYLKWFAVVDKFIRESLAIDLEGSVRLARVIKVLPKLTRVHGARISFKVTMVRNLSMWH